MAKSLQIEVHTSTHGLRTPRESFFLSKIRNFLAWADKLGWNSMRRLQYFWQIYYNHYFGTASLLFIGKCSWFSFLQKTLVFRSKTYNSQIKCSQNKMLAVKNLENSVHTSVFGGSRYNLINWLVYFLWNCQRSLILHTWNIFYQFLRI